MRVAAVVGVAAVALMLAGALVLGLDDVSGRVMAGIGIVLLWVPLTHLIRARRRRRERDDQPSTRTRPEP